MLRSYVDILWALIETAVVIAVAGYLYLHYVRPLLVARGLLDFEDRWLAWFKQRWDVTGAVALAALAGVWNSLLDGIIAVIHVLPQFSDALSGVDLTPLTLPEWLRAGLQVLFAVIPIIRAMVLLNSRPRDEG